MSIKPEELRKEAHQAMMEGRAKMKKSRALLAAARALEGPKPRKKKKR